MEPIFPNEVLYSSVLAGIAKTKKIKIYLVGGFLRDSFLNSQCRDFDFAVSRNAIAVARLFSRKIKGAFVLLDEEHGCARVVKKQDGSILTFDFADFREKTILGDLAHRDFTINSLCIDIHQLQGAGLSSAVVMDPNGGLKDLKSKTIRMVSKRAFREDPLRLVRAFSLQASLGFTIESKTLAQIKKETVLLKGVAFERIRDELFKILQAPRTAENLAQMKKLGLLQKIIPQVTVMFGVKQGGYHHLDVWEHSLQAIRELEGVFEEFAGQEEISAYLQESLAGERTRLSLLKLAMLLHDVGKPATLKKEKGRMSFHGHEHVGKHISRHAARLLMLSTRERYILEDVVRWHLRPGYLSNFKSPSQRAIFRYFRDTKDEAVGILLVSLADQRATRGPLTSAYDQKHHEAIIKRLIQYYYDKRKEKPLARLITGNDLIRKLKLKPSAIFAKILQTVEEQHALGRVRTKNDALTLAKTIALKA